MITRRAAGILVPLALLAACTTERTGAPRTTAPSVTPSFGAPSVADPLDDAAFQADPCASLTPAQQAEFGMDGGNERTVGNGIKCDYSGAGFVSVLFSNKDTGLSYLYELNEEDLWASWEPFRLDGYPAVTYVDPGRESCDVAVGLSDTKYFMASVLAAPGDDEACAQAQEWAARVLETVKAGQ